MSKTSVLESEKLQRRKEIIKLTLHLYKLRDDAVEAWAQNRLSKFPNSCAAARNAIKPAGAESKMPSPNREIRWKEAEKIDA